MVAGLGADNTDVFVTFAPEDARDAPTFAAIAEMAPLTTVFFAEERLQRNASWCESKRDGLSFYPQ